MVVETQFLSLHAEESPFRRGFTHAQKLVDCRPDTRRKAATGEWRVRLLSSGTYFSGFLREIRHPSCHPLIASNLGGDVNGSSETSGSLPLYRHSSLTLIVKESGFVKPLFDFSKSIVITTARAWASAVNFALEAAQISIIFRPPHEIAEKEFFYKRECDGIKKTTLLCAKS